MLYKKIHRQYIREFWIGRKFILHGETYEITKKPRIGFCDRCINVNGGWPVIEIAGPHCSGKIKYKGAFVWLDD